MAVWRWKPDPKKVSHATVSVGALHLRNHRASSLCVNRLCEAVHTDLRRRDDMHRDVLFFIHGHRLSIPGLRLGLLRELHDQYVEPKHGPVGVIIFFAWPDRGWPWSEDEEAYRAGCAFFALHAAMLAALSCAAGGRLHLLVQSFGHHLLAGMMAKAITDNYVARPFRSCLLVAADVPQESIACGGVRLSGGDGARDYRLDQMQRFGEQTVVYYDPGDWILPISRRLVMPCYRRLGRLGCKGLRVPRHITCQDVGATGDLPRNPLQRHQYFIHSPAVVRMIAAQIRC